MGCGGGGEGVRGGEYGGGEGGGAVNIIASKTQNTLEIQYTQ